MRLRKLIILLILLPGLLATVIRGQDFSNSYNIIIANDLGRNGYFDQKPIAKMMGIWAEKADIEFVAAPGDVHHFNGVKSVTDPLWMTNYELIYSDPSLMLDWFSTLGNHEYRGNTTAVLDYRDVSRRWMIPSRYYSFEREIDKENSALFLFTDTTPLINKYRSDSTSYPDACKQDYHKQLNYIDSVLTHSKAKWKIVFGHHPVYAETKKNADERKDMQERLDPILRKYNVDFYINGHIHNFQHIKLQDSPVHYFTNSSASLSRNVNKTEGTQFCSGDSGFAILSVSGEKLTIYFINKKGNIIYSFEKR